ncbi:MAG: hypothetical protein LBE38_03910 [Deltaproteobacteria bacterium]|jgi:hypothetical protein|nr:hypothetical protein [Deltaproteobacteria bacterium]
MAIPTPEQLQPMQTLLLWDLLSRGGGEFLKYLTHPEYKFHTHREPLIQLKLITENKMKEEVDGKLLREKLKLQLTDLGWEYLQKNIDLPKNPKSPNSGLIMGRLLRRLSSYVQIKNIKLAQLFGLEPISSQPQLTAAELLKDIKIIRRNLQTAGGALRLSDIRKNLPQYSRNHMDKLLLELQRQHSLVLFRYDTPELVTPEDAEAAIIIAGEPKHLFYLQ